MSRIKSSGKNKYLVKNVGKSKSMRISTSRIMGKRKSMRKRMRKSMATHLSNSRMASTMSLT